MTSYYDYNGWPIKINEDLAPDQLQVFIDLGFEPITEQEYQTLREEKENNKPPVPPGQESKDRNPPVTG